jgi:hypothetical protein
VPFPRHFDTGSKLPNSVDKCRPVDDATRQICSECSNFTIVVSPRVVVFARHRILRIAVQPPSVSADGVWRQRLGSRPRSTHAGPGARGHTPHLEPYPARCATSAATGSRTPASPAATSSRRSSRATRTASSAPGRPARHAPSCWRAEDRASAGLARRGGVHPPPPGHGCGHARRATLARRQAATRRLLAPPHHRGGAMKHRVVIYAITAVAVARTRP